MEKVTMEFTVAEAFRLWMMCKRDKIHRIGPGQYSRGNSFYIYTNPIAAWLFGNNK